VYVGSTVMSPYYIAFAVWASYVMLTLVFTGSIDKVAFGVSVGLLCSSLYDMYTDKDDV
jgi:hypothetical protein